MEFQILARIGPAVQFLYRGRARVREFKSVKDADDFIVQVRNADRYQEMRDGLGRE